MKKTLWQLLPHDYAPFFRSLHISIAVLIVSQIINSNFTEREALTGDSFETWITWFHVISGFLLILLGVILISWMLTQRGVNWYFSWITLDVKGIVQDLKTLSRGQLPQAGRGGIAATIQGLGVMALLLVACSGGIWFIVNNISAASPQLTRSVMQWHKFLTTFIEIYFYAHGAMGLLHIFLAHRKTILIH